MRLAGATLYALHIPFAESFNHSAHLRRACDSVVVRVVDDDGVVGFGEGAARPYVTGETPDLMLRHLADELWPRVAGVEVPDPIDAGLAGLDALLEDTEIPGVIAPNASRCALTLAILDGALRTAGRSVGAVLAPRRATVTYGGVVTASAIDAAVRRARQMTRIGLSDIKLKVGLGDDVERVRAVRNAIGPGVSLRLDANGAWDLGEAIRILDGLAPFSIAAIEEPLSRQARPDLATLRGASPVPIMVDESLVTLGDAEVLLGDGAVDLVNIRVSKCGGLHRSAEIARLAFDAGVGVQVGSHVGETAILAGAGRHLAAWLPDVAFVEGSYGGLLLAEDMSVEPVRFGRGGIAPVLDGEGLGVDIVEDRLRRYSTEVVELAGAARR